MSANTIVLQAFTLTFVAEWGDRSQIATIAMAADQDLVGVTLGGAARRRLPLARSPWRARPGALALARSLRPTGSLCHWRRAIRYYPPCGHPL
eukprot:5563778-Prymnesium_polylepis.1